MITDSNNGHVFEVTEGGDIIWEFWNPQRNEEDTRLTIYRMERYGLDYLRYLE